MTDIRTHVLVTMERGGTSLPEFYSASDVVTVPRGTSRETILGNTIDNARKNSFGQSGMMIFWQVEPDELPPGEYHYAITVKVCTRNSQSVSVKFLGTSGVYTISGGPHSRATLFVRTVKQLVGARPGGEVSVTFWSLAPRYIMNTASQAAASGAVP